MGYNDLEERRLSDLIRRSEERLISYKGSKKVKGLIRMAYEDQLPSWYMAELKHLKNEEEKFLKYLQKEQQYHRQGMNPPSCYPNLEV